MNIIFSKTVPTEAGQYLIKWAMPERLELITVVDKPACSEFGFDWPAYLAIAEWAGKSVTKINMDMAIGISNKLQ